MGNKLLVSFLCVLLVLFSVNQNETLAENVVNLEGGLLVDGKTMLPLRSIFENLGASVEWNSNTQQATALKDGKFIDIQIGSTIAVINGNEEKEMEVPPKLINGKTMIPVRFVSEELGAIVEWDQKNYITTISLGDKVLKVNVDKPQIQNTKKQAIKENTKNKDILTIIESEYRTYSIDKLKKVSKELDDWAFQLSYNRIGMPEYSDNYRQSIEKEIRITKLLININNLLQQRYR